MADETRQATEQAGDEQTAGEVTTAAEVAEGATTSGEPSTGGPEPIRIELDDLTEEARQKAESETGRKIEDEPYEIKAEDSKPGSILEVAFEVPRESFDREQERMLNELRKDVTLPGFRKGKAPLKLLRLRLGEEAVRDTLASLATNVLRRHIAARELKPVANPQVIEYSAKDAAAPVSFKVELELEPKVELKQYKGFEVEVEVQPVGEEQVDARLEEMRRANAVMESAPEGAQVNPGDNLVVDIDVTNDEGQRLEHLCETARPVQDLERDLPEGIGTQIVGKQVGDSLSARVPQEVTNRRGESVIHEDTHTVTIRDIRISRLPDLDDEFAKDLGTCESLDELRAAIRKELEDAEEQRQRQAAIRAINEKLIEANPVDPPRSLLNRQQYEQIMEHNYQLQRFGLRLEQVVNNADVYMAAQRADAERQLRSQLIIGEIMKAENLEVGEQDVEDEINRISEQTGRKPLAIRARLEAEKQLDAFRQMVARRKIEGFLLENSTVNKVPAREPQAGAESTETADE